MLREALVQLPADFTTPNQMHKAVWAALGMPHNSQRDFLFLDVGEGQVLVRGSSLPPDSSLAVELPAAGEQVAFSIAVRAVKRSVNGERLVDRTYLQAWLTERMPGFGDIDLAEAVAFKTSIKGHPVWAWSVKGTSVVTDPDQAGEILSNGLGRSKAFGFGLLVLISLEDNLIEAA